MTPEHTEALIEFVNAVDAFFDHFEGRELPPVIYEKYWRVETALSNLDRIANVNE